MRLCLWMMLLALGCRKSDGDTGSNGLDSPPPASCVADNEVCAAFGSDWTQEQADSLCAELGGAEGECAEGELGRCVLEDGLVYFLYEMPPLDAAAYCDYLRGEWLKPGEESEED